jgi:hypothetical protein
MDEDSRTCGRCKGKALLEGVEEHSTDVEYSVSHIPIGSARVEGGALIRYACACGNRFTFISRLRRARFFGSLIFGALFGYFWWWLSTGMGRRSSYYRPADDGLGPFVLLAGVFLLVAVGSLLAILADAYSRLRNGPWRGD